MLTHHLLLQDALILKLLTYGSFLFANHECKPTSSIMKQSNVANNEWNRIEEKRMHANTCKQVWFMYAKHTRSKNKKMKLGHKSQPTAAGPTKSNDHYFKSQSLAQKSKSSSGTNTFRAQATIKSTDSVSSVASIAVLTSGGDSQGMNCVLYGLVKCAERFTDVYLVHNGYEGLVYGGPKLIEKADSEKLARYLHQGGTIIGSSRCAEFRLREWRKQACNNLLQLNIQNLLVVGGDGSLTGANLLRSEWSSFVNELQLEGVGKGWKHKMFTTLNLIGIIGSIDNDFNGSDMTVGTDSALARIVDAVEAIRTTAASHQRAFVIEVMGRNCGYLALATAMAIEASFCLIPELPQKEGWQERLKERIEFEKKRGVLYHLVIISEGARSLAGTVIKAQEVRNYMHKQLNMDVRTVVLAHLQRGGHVSAYDRLMSVLLGTRAAEIFKETTFVKVHDHEAVVLTICQGKVEAKNLMACIDDIKLCAQKMKHCKWEEVLELRGQTFVTSWNNYLQTQSLRPATTISVSSAEQQNTCWAVMHVSSIPVPGMNAVVHALARHAHSTPVQAVFGIHNGLQGLLHNQMIQLHWETVANYCNSCGSLLASDSSQRSPALSLDRIENTLRVRNISSLLVVGDNRAYDLVRALAGALDSSETLRRLSIVFIPAAVTPTNALAQHCWLGYDSLLNRACNELSNIHLTNVGTHNRLFLVQTDLHMATIDFLTPGLFGLANGVSCVYPSDKQSLLGAKHTPSETFQADRVKQDAQTIRAAMQKTGKNSMVLSHTTLANDVFQAFQGIFSRNPSVDLIRICLNPVVGPMNPSPFDRKLGLKFGILASQHFLSRIGKSNEACTVTRPMIISRAYKMLPL